MMGGRRRGNIWKLVLPFPLAVLLLVGAYIGTHRAWQGTLPSGTSGGPETPAQTVPSEEPEGEGIPAVTTEERPSAVPSPPEAAPAKASQEPTAAPLPAPPPSRDTTQKSGPAPVEAAPSHEAALRTSEPPPAAASAPSPVPAPVVPLVPAPEPKAAPRAAGPEVTAPSGRGWARESVRAVRFDAGYYYGRGLSAPQLDENLTRSWSEQGINLVYFYAYNRVYGARYYTRHPGNTMEDFGRQDLLGHMLKESHRRGIKVIAWLNGVQHKRMWEAHPEWREKTQDGADYRPDAESYLLCVRNPEVMAWWLGFVDDLLTHYPELDGIDLAEFQIDLWGDHACHCEHCRGQFAEVHPGEAVPGDEWREFRAEGLTRLLLATSRLAQSYGKETHITTVFTAGRDGRLMSAEQVRDAIGFDLEGVLAGPSRPEVIQAELIWQQWAALYGDGGRFTAEWTRDAVREAKRMVGGRARLIAHVEVTDFGRGGLDGVSLARTIAAAVRGGPDGVDIYDSYQLEKTEEAVAQLETAWLSFGD